jgi:hypothetical protein
MYEYLVRYEGYSSKHDEWVRIDEVKASRLKRKIRGMSNVAGPTGSGIVLKVNEAVVNVTYDLGNNSTD